ncbi:hypothetical protein F511_18654 [Dorcoceras hygrometricum]|uniref:Uncharacterized protein n=1 Tax=Dorcoceras hygrometricum TaxID=472368 RepID=A0A2Z7DFV4_9LAMI|nr:hypothetical protein F511_18654 [Dorcoceras hygrometricum]
MASNTRVFAVVAILFLAAFALTPSCDASRVNLVQEELTGPICPACVCCVPPPPGKCCAQCCAFPYTPVAVEHENSSP